MSDVNKELIWGSVYLGSVQVWYLRVSHPSCSRYARRTKSDPD